MATYQIINLKTGEFSTVTLEQAVEIASLDPHEIEWAIEEHGVCETDTFQITKLPEPPEECDASDAGDAENETLDEAEGGAENKFLTPVFVFMSREEFEAHLAESPAAVIRLQWGEPIVRSAVEADRERVMAQLRGDAGGGDKEPSAYHLTRESIALIR
jgi:hypothetical protein